MSSTSEKDNSRVELVESNKCINGVELVNPYRTNKVNTSDLVDLAREIQQADTFVHSKASNQLQIIADQVRFLQERAKRILQEAKESYDLHHVPCNFVKKCGNIYYLYKRPSGKRYFSMLSPEEWGSACPQKFDGAFRLEQDNSWTPDDKIRDKEADQKLINKILSNTNTLSITMAEN